MKLKMLGYALAATLALPANAEYGKDGTQIMFAFGGGGNNARLYAEVLAQAERDRKGKPVTPLADRVVGNSAGALLAALLTLPHHSDGRPMTADEALEHLRVHAPNILTVLAAGALQADKTEVQAAIRNHMTQALGSNAKLRVSDLPLATELKAAELKGGAMTPVSFDVTSAIIGAVPDATLAEVLTAAVAVEKLAGQVELSDESKESKGTRSFMDAGSRGKHDPTPELIEAALRTGKPVHIFAFESGFGFDPRTVAWAKETLKVEDRQAKGLDMEGVDPKFVQVRVHLFQSSTPDQRECGACLNLYGLMEPTCKDHDVNTTLLAGEWVSVAQGIALFDAGSREIPLPVLAMNVLGAMATDATNAKLAQVAEIQMTGRKDARTASYTKLLAVLAEADGGTTSSSASGAGDAKGTGEFKETKS